MKILTTKNDLRNWVDEHMGADATPEIVTAVTEWISSSRSPALRCGLVGVS